MSARAPRPMVAVDDALGAVQAALEAAGFTTVSVTAPTARNAQAVVVNGADGFPPGFLGMTPTTAAWPMPVINADGLTANQVVAQVKSRLEARGAE
jgi:hypothetical protein